MKTKHKETYNGLAIFGTLTMLIPAYLGLYGILNKPEAVLMSGIGLIIFCTALLLND